MEIITKKKGYRVLAFVLSFVLVLGLFQVPYEGRVVASDEEAVYDGFRVNGSVVADKAGNGIADISLLSEGTEVVRMEDVEVTVSKMDDTKPKLRYIDLRDESALALHGLCMDENSEVFSRMDTDVALQIAGNTVFSKNSVYTHARESAGGRIRFSTDSSIIAMKAEYPTYVSNYASEMGAGKTGFDVYVDTEAGSTYYGTIAPTQSQLPGADREWEFEGKVEFETEEMRNITIYFPITNEVSEVSVGVEEDATVAANAVSYDDASPIVYYGSSITQGGNATRPGLTYVNTIGRMLGRDYIDLGVWGSAKGQTKFAEYIAGLDMSAFVFDYDHNCSSAVELEETHWDFYQTVRLAHSEIPIIFISRPNTNLAEWPACRAVIQANYEAAVAAGDENVYFIDGQTFFEGEENCLSDGIHPTDKGHSLMAADIGGLLANVLGKTLPIQEADVQNQSLPSSLNKGNYLITLKDELSVKTNTTTVDKVFVVEDLSQVVTSMKDSRWTGNTTSAKPRFTVDTNGKATLVASPSAASALSMLNVGKNGGKYGNFYVEYTLTMSNLPSEKNTYYDQFFCMESYGTTGSNAWDSTFFFDTRASQAPKKTFWARLKTASGTTDSFTKNYSDAFADIDIGEGKPMTIGMLVCESTVTLTINGEEAATYTGTTPYSGWFGIWLGNTTAKATIENFIYVPLSKEVVDVEFSCPATVMQDAEVEVYAIPIYSWPYEKGEQTSDGVIVSGLDTSTVGQKTFKAVYGGVEKELSIMVTKKPDGFRINGPVVADKEGNGIADITILAGDIEVEDIEDAEVQVVNLVNPSVGLYEKGYEVTYSVMGTERTAVSQRVFVVDELSDAVTTMSDSRWTGQTVDAKPNFNVDETGKATLVASASPSQAFSILNVGEADGKYKNFYVEYTLTLSNLPEGNNAFQNYLCMGEDYGVYNADSLNASFFFDTRPTTVANSKFWARLRELGSDKNAVWAKNYSDKEEDPNVGEGKPMKIGMIVCENTVTMLINGKEAVTYTRENVYSGWFGMWMGATTATVTVEDFIYVPLGQKAVQDIEFSYPKTVLQGSQIEVSAIPVYTWPYGKGEAVSEGVAVSDLDTSVLGETIFKASYNGVEKELKIIVSDSLFEETFDGTLNEMTETGWGNVSNKTVSLKEGQLYLALTQEGLYLTELPGSVKWTDYTVSADVTMTSNGTSASTNVATIVARSTGLKDGYEWSLCADKDGNTYVRLYDRGAKKQLMKVDYPIDFNEVYTLKITVVGDTIKGYVNGEKIIETVADTCPTGTVGVRRNGYAAYYDNLSVTLPEEDEPIKDVTKQQIWFTDTFSSENAMSERGWNIDGTISKGQLILGGKQTTAFLDQLSRSENWTDYTAQVEVMITDSDEVSPVGTNVSALVVRSTSASSGYEFGVTISSSDNKGGFRLYNRTTGELMESTDEIVAERGKSYQLTMVVEGDRIRCFVDGILVFDVTDCSNPKGYVGLRTGGYSGAYDNIVVRKVTDADRKGNIQNTIFSPTTGDFKTPLISLITMLISMSAVVMWIRRRLIEKI